MAIKWGDISKEIWQAQNDITDVCNMAPSNRHGNEKAEATEIDQWTIDEMYNFLGTASVNTKAAMAKLRPHTTYFKEENNDTTPS